MNVTQAVLNRSSKRSFINKPVSTKLIKALLEVAARSPSGGNLQPWRIYVLNKEAMEGFKTHQANWSEPEVPEYDIYPPSLKEPYRTQRYNVGEQMYSKLGIERDNKEGRFSQVLKNFDFFGAPAALFCFIDRDMGPPQWSDLGMFLQTFMLLALEAGLDTCAQEAWSLKHESVSDFCNADDNLMLFCGMAIGFNDAEDPVNTLKTDRLPLDEWATFL
jgi:nitroreductase